MGSGDDVERRLAALLSADVVGYSRLMARDEIATVRALEAHRARISELVTAQCRRVVDAPGDNLLAEFGSALEATTCALAIQAALLEENRELPEDVRMQFRIGVHLGDVVVRAERIYGDGVNITARLEALAPAGGLCVSATVHDQVRDKLDVEFEDLGEQDVKNLPHPVHVFWMVGSDAPTRHRALPLRGLAAAALLLLVGAGLYLGRDLISTEPGEIRVIAVLPFDNLSADPDEEYFVDGMTEELIARLARVSSLRVISRTSSMRYKNSNQPLPEIAEALGVDAIVEGSVRRADGRVRITAQLIHAGTDLHVWADSYDRDVARVLEVQAEVAAAIARNVHAALSPAQAERLSSAPDVDPAAYDAYLRGRYHWNRRTLRDLWRAVEYFNHAVKLDADYAPGYAGLADSYLILSINFDAQRPAELIPQARSMAQRALDLDPSLAEAHASLGNVAVTYDRDWTLAEAHFRRSFELDPSYAPAHSWYAMGLSFLKRFDEAREHVAEARLLDPLSPILAVQRAAIEYRARNTEVAGAILRELLEREPDFPAALSLLARLSLRAGKSEEALAAADALPDSFFWVIERNKTEYVGPSRIAFIYLGLGEVGWTLEWLRRGEADRSLIPGLLSYPDFDPLRSDERFQALVRDLTLPVDRTTRTPGPKRRI